MVYFEGIKVGDRVWSLVYGWGVVTEVNPEDKYAQFRVKYDVGGSDYFNYDGKYAYDSKTRQVLFWSKVKLENTEKPEKIELEVQNYLINLGRPSIEVDDVTSNIKIEGEDEFYNYAHYGLMRNDYSTADKAREEIIKFARLLALRDQECPNSRGYKFEKGEDNHYLVYYTHENCWYVYTAIRAYQPGTVYFKTHEDAQKIADILNEGRFTL